jgi:GTP:adenosylcobinamide-phosphate guanylyltransferase
MESSHLLAHELNELLQTHGLTPILEAINDLIVVRINAIDAFEDQFDQQQVEALKKVNQALTELSQTSLIDMDVEIALEQLMHASGAIETKQEKLSSGLE